MIIYLDESYDSNRNYFLLGALFNSQHRALLRKIRDIKNLNQFFDNNGKYKEIKYSNCYCEENYKIATLMIDSFMQSNSYFRAVVVDMSNLNLNKFGSSNEDNKIKKARAYKKFAEMLISYNSSGVRKGVLLTDRKPHCDGDKFIARMREKFCFSNTVNSDGDTVPLLKYINEIDSKLEQYQVMQLNDILLGCIINNIYPSSNSWKNNLRTYLVSSLKVPNLLKSFWNLYTKTALEKMFPKYNIWYWKP